MNCPANVNCFGGSSIGPKAGYWRESADTDIILECPNKKACLGTYSINDDPKGECAKYYSGYLCTKCDEGRILTSDFVCDKCPTPLMNILRLTFVTVLFIGIIILMIRSTLIGAIDTKNVTSVYFKILMNHIQIVSITSTFNFNWTELF